MGLSKPLIMAQATAYTRDERQRDADFVVEEGMWKSGGVEDVNSEKREGMKDNVTWRQDGWTRRAQVMGPRALGGSQAPKA